MTLVGRDGLVGRDHARTTQRPAVERHRRRLACPDVVLDRLAGVRLHHRHVLVRRGVEDDVRTIVLEHGPNALAVE